MLMFIELFLLGIGLAMDAFAVSVCKGLGMRRLNKKQTLIIGLYFGGFQALMPLIGWLLGSQFQKYITSIDALAVGITFAFLDTPIIEAITIIGITTMVISIIGVVVGNFFGSRYKSKAEFIGGLILVLLGLKILLEHLGILVF